MRLRELLGSTRRPQLGGGWCFARCPGSPAGPRGAAGTPKGTRVDGGCRTGCAQVHRPEDAAVQERPDPGLFVGVGT